MRDFLEFIGIMVACSVVVIGVAVGGYSLVESHQCSSYEANTGKQTRYSGLRCYVNDGGSWYAWDEYKNRLATKGEFGK